MTTSENQNNQVRNSQTYDDTFASPGYGSDLETTPTNLEDDPLL